MKKLYVEHPPKWYKHPDWYKTLKTPFINVKLNVKLYHIIYCYEDICSVQHWYLPLLLMHLLMMMNTVTIIPVEVRTPPMTSKRNTLSSILEIKTTNTRRKKCIFLLTWTMHFVSFLPSLKSSQIWYIVYSIMKSSYLIVLVSRFCGWPLSVLTLAEARLSAWLVSWEEKHHARAI